MIKITIEEYARLSKTLRALASDRTIYTDMIFSAYSDAVDQAFRTQGFGTWKPLKAKSKLARRKGWSKHYKLPPNSATYAYPANTWTARMRDTIAGRTSGQRFLQFGRGVQNINIRAATGYMGWALEKRPLEGPVIDRIVQIMSEKIHAGIIKNVEIAIS